MAKLKSGTRIYGTATIDTSVVVGSVVTLSSSGIQSTAQITSTGTVSGTNITTGGNVTGSSASVVNAVTFNNGGAGAASGTTFNGSAVQTISYNTLGASPLAGSSSLTTTGTVTSGTWSGSFGAVSGANLTSLTAGNLSGTIPSAVLGNSTAYVGTTAILLNRASANQALTGILSVAMPGSTSGTITVQPTAVAGTNTITLPASTGTVALTSDLGNGTLTMAVSGTGLSGSASFTANQSGNTTFTVTSNATNANTASTIVARDASGNFSAGTITAAALTVSGDLTVNGTTTTINSTTVTVDDKNIELGSIASPTDTTADGGGITLKGTTDKTLNWLSATGAWTSSEDFNLVTGKIYAIAGTTVLSASQVLGKTLPSGVVIGSTDTQTLTNKTIAAGSNTISGLTNSNLSGTAGITNANLANSTISGVALGSNLATLTMGVSGTGLSGSTTFNGSGAATFTVTINATNANTASTVVARDASGNFSAGTITASLTGAASLNVLKAGDTITGQLISTLANSTTTGGGQIYLNGATGNRIDFNTNGVAAPAIVGATGATRSVGTKIILYPTGTPASEVDFAFGVEATAIWSSVPSSSQSFKWYAGTTNIATLSGLGALSVTGTVSGTNITTGGNVTGSSASVANSVTFNNGGAGDASGTTFNGSAARIISYNTVGASPLAGSSSLTTTGTVTSGTWSGSFGAVSGANLTSLNASNLGSGTVPTARLGTGTADATTYLRGDNTWATVTSGSSVTVSDDTSTNAVRYPIFEDITSGTSTTVNVSSTKLTFNPSTGVLLATGFSGSGANLTSLPAGNLSGTIPSAVLGNSTAYVGTTAILLNRASANQALTGISSVAMPGSTSGTITLQPTAVAGTNTITLPASTGTVALTSDLGNGTLTMAVSGTGLSGSATFTANQSGASTFTVTSNATNANTASAIVARDASGNFSAGTITAALTGNVTGNVTGSSGSCTGNAATVTTNANLTGDVTSIGNATSIAAGVIVDADINASAAIADTKLATISTTGKVSNSATTATSANTASTIVARDASGNFSAGTITAAALTVSGDLTVNGTTTTINSTTVTVDDINIELGSIASPTNTTANGGGITLKGATDKTINWLSATGAWTSSEDFNLVTGKVYAIAGTTVLSASQVLGKTLPSGVVVGTSDTQTLSNKTISGANNTLSNIANASLTNSTISGIALGANLNTLTMNVSGTGLSGSTTYNGSAAATFTVTINATNANTASTVVARDASGNFSAGTITANLTGNCSGSSGSCSGNSATSTYATYVSSPDGDRNSGTKLPTTTPQSVRFDFSSASSAGTGGNYAGVMTYAPWTGTTASTGDASYQLAFGSTATNGGGIPKLNIRKGIDSTWNSWYTLLHSGNYTDYSPSLTGTGASGSWGISVTGSSASCTGNAATATSSPLLSALGNYVWTASTLPTSFSSGITCSFVQASNGFQNYGSVMTMNTYSGGGGSLQLYVPYSPTYGGTGLQVRFGNYDVSSGNSWTSWKTLLASDNYNSYAPTLTGTGASGSWGINVTGSSASCTGNAATATTASNLTGLTLNSSAAAINPDSVTQNQIGYDSSVSLFGQSDGGLYSSAYSSSWIHQIHGDFRTGQIAIRGKNNGTWQAWRRVLDSTNYSASNAWTPNLTNITPSFTSPGTFTKTSGTNSVWDSQIYSTEGYTTNVFVSCSAAQTNGWIMWGLNSDPTTDASYSSLDYSFYFVGDGTLRIYESNVDVNYSGTYVATDVLTIIYDGTNISYFKNNTLVRRVARAYSTTKLYLDSSFYTLNASLNNLSFGVIPITTTVQAGADQAIVNQNDGNSSTWYGRILSKNATSDKAAFLGTYGSIAGVFAHNNALNAWADIYVNTVDGSSGGAVRMPSSVFLNGNQALHAGNYNSYSPTLTGTGASGSWGISVTGSSASCTGNAVTATTAGALTTGNNYQVNSFGVGTAPSGTTGEIRATNNVTAYYSDERLKENIKPITSALSKLLTLRGVTFNSNKVAEQYGYTDKKEQVGVIAQDVEKVLPQIVVSAPFDIAQDEDGNEYSKSGENYKTVHYDKLVPLLIEAIKELKSEIEELKLKIST